jgi:hypothetical protein
MLQRRLGRAQLLDLMLCEIADREPPPFVAFAYQWRKLSRQKLHERRLAGPVRSQKTNARTGTQREIDVREDDAPFAIRRERVPCLAIL